MSLSDATTPTTVALVDPTPDAVSGPNNGSDVPVAAPAPAPSVSAKGPVVPTFPAGSWQEALHSTLTMHWNGRHMVLSPDVDGVLSALCLLERFPDARCIGVYNCAQLILFDDATIEEARAALWVDCDVADGILCVGQHIVRYDRTDTIPNRHPHSFNPNEWAGKCVRDSFGGVGAAQDKYPYGTVHFLAAALQVAVPAPRTPGRAAFYHADSAWFNARKYALNAASWNQRMFSDVPWAQDELMEYTRDHSLFDTHRAMIRGLCAAARIDGKDYLNTVSHATNTGGKRARNYDAFLEEQWAPQCCGYQSLKYDEPRRPRHETDPHLRALVGVWQYLSALTGWALTVPPPRRASQCLPSHLKIVRILSDSDDPRAPFASETYPQRRLSLEECLVEQKSISHAFVTRNRLQLSWPLIH